ncbi:hypothetical protein Hypma_008532 [Hypsizygus marmoreus]|uniref:Uncharacterized protein n=1 Tax=Hypsizygus marmoreus TaxID=39966 RepID=A0A369JYH1_HYPMA|nr:hypothetical protein Hypma_008532 [Hypsizygus marmoreus]
MHRRREPRPQQPKKFETRRFSTERRSSLYGYLDTPNVDDKLEFTRLPHFAYYTGRLVQIGRRIWELWSPNSLRSPFYPGKCCDNFLLDPPLALHFRRVDGHLGRFDPTVSPQEIDQDAWLPFIRRRIPMGAKIQDYPEFVVVPNVWLADDAPARHSGTLNPHFLQTYKQRNAQLDAQMERLQGIYLKRPRWWTRCPLYPYGANFKSLMKSVTYDFAVDTLNTIHHGVKLKAAWIELVERFLVDSDWSEEIQLRRGLEPANDDFMGTWVNKALKPLSLGSRARRFHVLSFICTHLKSWPRSPTFPSTRIFSRDQKRSN